MVRTITCAPNIECDDRNNDMMRFFQRLFNVRDKRNSFGSDCRNVHDAIMRARIERTTRDNVMRDAQRDWVSSREYRNVNGYTR